MFKLDRFKKKNILAINDKGKYFNYNQAYDFSIKFNEIISERCLIFILSENNIESLFGYLACITNRIVPLLLDASIDKTFLRGLLINYKPKYVWLNKTKIPDHIDHNIVFNENDYVLIKLNNISYYDINNQLALLLSTSGSTGSPKMVRISYQNLESNAKSIAQYLNLSENSKPIITLPMSYSFGLSIINSHILVGGTLLITNKTLFEKEFWDFFNNEQPNSISGVPYTFEILKKLRFLKRELSFLKTITQAGGKLDIDLNKEYAQFCIDNGIDFYIMYGQTEASPRMSYLPSEQSLNKLGSIGIAIPGGNMFLINETGKPINEVNCVGELVYEGDNVSLGYSESYTDLIKGDENKGTLFTGDLAKKDPDGFFYVVGRKKRFIKLYGNRINLDDIEKIILNHADECGCIGSDSNLIVFLVKGKYNSNFDFKKFVSIKIGVNARNIKIKTLDALPKSKSGKTLYSRLKNLN